MSSPATRPLTGALLERTYFEDLKTRTFAALKPGEHLFINLSAEQSQFVRINAARVRQIGTVEDAICELSLVLESGTGVLQKAQGSINLTGISYEDVERIQSLLHRLREEAPQLPADPYAQLPKDLGSSHHEETGELLELASAADALLQPVHGVDIAGIFASGRLVRAMANSAGQLHWFSTANFSLDYSLYTSSQRALKGTFAGAHWDPARYSDEMRLARNKLDLLEKPARKLERGAYRVFMEPAAYSELVGMLSWGGVSEASIRQGDSPLRLLRDHAGQGAKQLSPLFSLTEDFSSGQVPRFNDEGELSPTELPLIRRGTLVNALVSSRTAKEYGATANGASSYESLRSPAVAAGTIARAQVLEKLGTGLHLSNLHYLNWSDQPGGRITGMTRYACFWVENGSLVSPIENMRFDDSIFSVFGGALEGLTLERAFLPEIGTYHTRNLGGTLCPGALLNEMKFTI
jgi:predicted Zn-dependent protease